MGTLLQAALRVMERLQQQGVQLQDGVPLTEEGSLAVLREALRKREVPFPYTVLRYKSLTAAYMDLQRSFQHLCDAGLPLEDASQHEKDTGYMLYAVNSREQSLRLEVQGHFRQVQASGNTDTNWLCDFFTEDLRLRSWASAASYFCHSGSCGTETAPGAASSPPSTEIMAWRQAAVASGSHAASRDGNRPMTALKPKHSRLHEESNARVDMNAVEHWEKDAPVILDKYLAWKASSKKPTSTFDAVTPMRLQRETLRKTQKVRPYRPLLAKSVFDFLGARRVLDMCAGWGERYVAALAHSSITEYTGIDPHDALKDRYFDMQRVLDPDVRVVLRYIEAAAEDLVPGKDILREAYTTVYLSPPPLNKETYALSDASAVARQAATRYQGRGSQWLWQFFVPVMKLAEACLMQGGTLVLDLSELETYNIRMTNTIVNAMNNACKSSMTLEGTLLFSTLNRKNKPTSSPRPLFVWRKAFRLQHGYLPYGLDGQEVLPQEAEEDSRQ
jgi:hypothetical protein